MEKSFLSFQSNYPSWEPNSQGKQFLSTLKIFREQKLQGQERIPAYLPPRMQQWNPNLRGQCDLNNFFSREALHDIPERAYQLGSLWLIDSDQKNYLNVLDWYYSSGPHLANETRRDVPSGSFNVGESTRNWIPPNMAHNEATYDKNWGQLLDDGSESHLEASTAAPLFQGNVLHHDDSVDASHHPSRSHWWARSNAPGGKTQTSFLEPPTFNRDTDHYYDNLSDRSITEEQNHLYWRRSNRLSQTFYMDDLEGGQFNLPFDDIYSRHSTSPIPDPSNLV